MNVADIPSARSNGYSRRLTVSLLIALALHMMMLLLPLYRWLGPHPGDTSGSFGGARPFVGELLGTNIRIRTPQPRGSEAPAAPQSVQATPSAQVTSSPQSAPQTADAVDPAELRVDLIPPATAGSAGNAAGDAASDLPGASLPPLAGGGGVPLEMSLDPETMKWPDPLTSIVVKRKIEDQVIVQVLVDRDGQVLDSRVLRSIPRCPECTASAVDAALGCRFEPPIYEGERVQAWVTLHFDFGMDSSSRDTSP